MRPARQSKGHRELGNGAPPDKEVIHSQPVELVAMETVAAKRRAEAGLG